MNESALFVILKHAAGRRNTLNHFSHFSLLPASCIAKQFNFLNKAYLSVPSICNFREEFLKVMRPAVSLLPGESDPSDFVFTVCAGEWMKGDYHWLQCFFRSPVDHLLHCTLYIFFYQWRVLVYSCRIYLGCPCSSNIFFFFVEIGVIYLKESSQSLSHHYCQNGNKHISFSEM